MKIIITTLLLISTLLANLKTDDIFPTLTLIDQFDNKIEVQKKGSSKVIISFEKDVSLAIKIFLDTKDDNFLAENNITYISDVSSVPSFLVGWVLLPKLKKFPYRVALLYDNKKESLNHQEGRVSIFTLDDGRVVGMEFVEAKELNAHLSDKA